jgi:hypothetical protein
MAKGLGKAQMSKARKILWDSAFFLERAHTEWKPRPRLEAKRPRLKSTPDVQEAIKAWAAIGVKVSAGQIREHSAMIEKWKKRKY